MKRREFITLLGSLAARAAGGFDSSPH